MIAIAAMSRNRVIGKGGRLPWHLPAELRWFQQTTLGHVVLMGRRTFREALGSQPLPGRLNLIATRHPTLFANAAENVEPVPDLAAFRPELLETSGRKVFVIGGAEIYREMLPRCAELLLTWVDREIEDGDTFFPEFEPPFTLAGVLLRDPDFEVRRYVNPSRPVPPGP